MKAVITRYPLLGFAISVLILVGIFSIFGLHTVANVMIIIAVSIALLVTFISMVKQVMVGNFGLDILAVLAMLSTLIVGEYLASLIIVIMLSGGEALEDYAEQRARKDLRVLLATSPQKAHKLVTSKTTPQTGKTAQTGSLPGIAEAGQTLHEIIEVPVESVNIGDELLIRAQEVIPIDGVSLENGIEVDQSSLTGESLPVTIEAGHTVMSGSVNGNTAFRMRTTALSKDSQYQQILRLVEQAEKTRAPIVRIADRFAIPFTIFSVLIASLAWIFSSDPVRFAEVLVLATPCPLLIAAPVAFIGGMNRATKRGIIFKTGAALETLSRTKTAAFDKTGTLTWGKPRIQDIRVHESVTNTYTETDILQNVASLEQYSVHVLASSVVEHAVDQSISLLSAENVTEVATFGIVGTVLGKQVRVGKLSFIAEVAQEAVAEPLAIGEVAIYVAIDNEYVGSVILADTVRHDAKETIAALAAEGITPIAMLTGDIEETAKEIANNVGIETVYSQLLPAEKVSAIAELKPKPSLMVGDGINDAPVLAAAEVGIAMGARGATAAGESADVIIVKDAISPVADAVLVAKETVQIALTAIWIGIILSVGLMAVAAFGYIPAIFGAISQEFIDLAAIVYALRAIKK